MQNLPIKVTIAAEILLMLTLESMHFCSGSVRNSKTDAANNTTKKTTNQYQQHCVISLDNSEILKELGSVWVNSEDPCAIHSCDLDKSGNIRETITKENCDQFYCDVDSEVRPLEGTCCGICVQTRCKLNSSTYEFGETWRNDDDCTLLECVQLANGQPMINVYQKNCPALPPDCAPQNVYMDNCCPYCRSAIEGHVRTVHKEGNENEDIWTEEFYRNHPCVRECKAGELPKTCHYTFVVEWYETLSKACYNCPMNITDCDRPHCIVGDGMPRSVTVVNRMMPGPSIEVCERDIVVVDVKNHLLGESTTIHWHGMHQKTTPYMDGVPHISQCPISPHAMFRYTFPADNAGTHFWHSHTGMQRGDGVFGAFIVRRPRSNEPHGHLYDFDLSEHKIILQDWVHVPGVSMFAAHHHSKGDNKPLDILVNGHGRFYKKIDQTKPANQYRKPTETFIPPPTVTSSAKTTSPITVDSTTMEPAPTYMPEPTILPSPIPVTMGPQILQRNDISSLGKMMRDMFVKRESAASQMPNAPESRSKRSMEDNSIPFEKIPLQIFKVQFGYRYRFRIINAEFLNCPIALSIDNHTLTAINSDSYDFEAVEVGSIVTYAGERFDFVVNANQTIGNYWIRLKGLMDCSEVFTSAHQVAILRYEGAADAEPHGIVEYAHNAEGIELNAMNKGSGHPDSLTIAEVDALVSQDNIAGVSRRSLKPIADYKFFVYYDFYAKDNPTFHRADLYGINAQQNQSNKLFTPQLNHISLKFPAVALLPQRDEISDMGICNETSLQEQGIDCRKEFCKCHHMLQVPLGAVVEFIIVDEGFTYDANHPFHLHGNAFRVVGLERLGKNVTIEMIKELDRYNLLKRNLERPPIKDTVTVPDGGYTIIRFEADNPGFWLFHCHIEFHAEIGMALILKVGNNDEMLPVPKNFPRCYNYIPSDKSDTTGSGEYTQSTHAPIRTSTANPSNAAPSARTKYHQSFSLLILAIVKLIIYHCYLNESL